MEPHIAPLVARAVIAEAILEPDALVPDVAAVAVALGVVEFSCPSTKYVAAVALYPR